MLPSGKRKTKYGKTQKEVKTWLQEQREAIKGEVWIESESTKIGEFLDRYIKDVAMHKLRPKTIESYQSMIDLHLKPELGALRLTKLRPENIQQMYSQKLNTGLSKRNGAVSVCDSA